MNISFSKNSTTIQLFAPLSALEMTIIRNLMKKKKQNRNQFMLLCIYVSTYKHFETLQTYIMPTFMHFQSSFLTNKTNFTSYEKYFLKMFIS